MRTKFLNYFKNCLTKSFHPDIHNKSYFFLILFFGLSWLANGQPDSFINAEGKHLIKDGHPYYFIGTNAWYFVNLASKGAGGDRARLIKELDQLQETGINNLRIMGGTEG